MDRYEIHHHHHYETVLVPAVAAQTANDVPSTTLWNPYYRENDFEDRQHDEYHHDDGVVVVLVQSEAWFQVVHSWGRP
jgi:hypothetical protein